MGGLGNFLQGAAGGALGGSSFGPGGALIGGVLGGLGGYFGSGGADDARKKEMDYFDYLGQHSPMVGPAAQGQYSQFRGNQQNLINHLEAQAEGRGPSLAAQQMAAATDRNIKQQSGLAQSGYGNPAAAQMAAANNSSELGAQAAQQSMLGRIQEQYNAQNLLGLNIHGARGADEDMNRFNAGQTNDMSMANLNAQLDTNRLRGMVLGQAGSGAGASDAQAILAGGAGMFGQYQQMQMLRRMQGQGGGNGGNSGGSYNGPPITAGQYTRPDQRY